MDEGASGVAPADPRAGFTWPSTTPCCTSSSATSLGVSPAFGGLPMTWGGERHRFAPPFRSSLRFTRAAGPIVSFRDLSLTGES